MFTGLIESLGCVVENKALQSGRRLLIKTDFDTVQTGESIALNGVCLTVLPDTQHGLAFDLSPETVSLTTLGALAPGQSVNIERALLVGSRMGGHYVSGHIDTTASIESLRTVGDFVELTVADFAIPAAPFLLPKGSITLDGVSLTINAVNEGCRMSVMLVPHTLAMTTFGEAAAGLRVNVEFDYLTRIVAHQLASFMPHTAII